MLRTRRLGVAWLLWVCLWLSGGAWLHAEEALPQLEVHFVDVGQGEATLFKSPSGRHILVDTGNLSTGYRVREYLKRQGIVDLEAVFVTHMHPDHVGGLFGLLPDITVRQVYDNGIVLKGNDFWEEYLNLLGEFGLQRRGLTRGERLSVGGIQIQVMSPWHPPTGDMNADSLVMMISYGKMRFLMTADLNVRGEKRLLEKAQNLRSDLLKIGHHGACDSTSEAFLNQVRPRIAILSVAEENRFNYPCERTIRRLEAQGVRLYRTDRDGTIVVHTDGEKISIAIRGAE